MDHHEQPLSLTSSKVSNSSTRYVTPIDARLVNGRSQWLEMAPTTRCLGRPNDLGDHVVEGLHDALIESREHLLQMTAGHDQLTESGIMRLA